MNYDLIAFDLDGTFLYNDKSVPAENIEALITAAEQGALIVPATGRIFKGLPAELKALPFLRYCILINGAAVYDIKKDRLLYSQELSLERSLEFLRYADTLPVMYDCYKDNFGVISRDMLENIWDYAPDPGVRRMIRTLRTPVDDLKEYLIQSGSGTQKLQLYFRDMELRRRMLEELPEKFPDMAITSSMPFNIEINSALANKGSALTALCRQIGLDVRRSVAFGDGTNDISMIRVAGLGVAMGNAADAVKAAADTVCDTNENCGMAKMIASLLK